MVAVSPRGRPGGLARSPGVLGGARGMGAELRGPTYSDAVLGTRQHQGSLDAAGAIRILSEEVFRGLVETTLSRVVFRNMTSEDRADDALASERQADQGRADQGRADQGRANDKLTAENGADEDQAAGGQASEREVGPHPPQDEPHPFDDLPQLDLNDPKAMRALAHPLRWALLE